jgi:ppGpp synthetase/RelA/SpoT-type nucleotidyltranferase
MNKEDIKMLYSQRYQEYLKVFAAELQKMIQDILNGFERIDRVSARAKGVESFMKKSIKERGDGEKSMKNPYFKFRIKLELALFVFIN